MELFCIESLILVEFGNELYENLKGDVDILSSSVLFLLISSEWICLDW